MPMKEQSRQVYKTAINGKEVDMHKLMMQNEMAVAVGNVRVNARGDELGPNGKIIRKQEDTLTAANIPVQKVASSVPVPEQKVQSKVATKQPKKNIENMDPEGNE